MPDRVETFAITVPPGTAKASAVQNISLSRVGVVVGIEIVIPDGVNGLAGFAIQNANQQAIPYNAGEYITGNNEVISWPLSNFPDAGSWQFDGYNTGNYPHTFYVRFLVNEVAITTPTPASSSASALIPASAIGGS